MAEDPLIIILGEDVQMIRVNLFTRFGKDRVKATPISESAFVGAAVGAALTGLKPVVEVMLVDFTAVAMDAILNHAAKIKAFSGGKWNVPLVIRCACGGGYGDGGQHEQCLWGWFAHIPGLSVIVPSTPADAGGLMLSALELEDPVIFLEHKLLSDYWLEYMGGSNRSSVTFDVPPAGSHELISLPIKEIPIGKAVLKRTGSDLTMVSIGVSVHRALEASTILDQNKISSDIIDLRTVNPLDKETIINSVNKTGRLLVIDEDYQDFGLSGELAAICLDSGLTFKFARVCTTGTIPYSRKLEDQILPNTKRIKDAVLKMM
jgi:pyruvate dehydrogenase E1 component beta subunit